MNGNKGDAFEKVVDCMLNDKSQIWNIIELENLYTSYGGNLMSRAMLFEKILFRLVPDLLTLSSIGVASIFVFRSHASKHMKLVANTGDYIDSAVAEVAKFIIKECKELKRDQFNI